jgi:hypothetical protein
MDLVALTPLVQQASGLLESSGNTNLTEKDLVHAIDLVDSILSRLPRDVNKSWLSIVDRLFSLLLQQTSTPFLPSSDSFCSMIITWSKQNSSDAAHRATFWLQQMIQTAEQHPKHVTPPRPSLFSTVFSAWEKRATIDPVEATRRGQELWHQLQDHCAENKHRYVPSSAYYMYISLWSKSGLKESPKMAEEILTHMVQAGKHNPNVVPSCAVFVNVISAWRKSDSPQAPEQAQAVLDLLVEEYQRRRGATGDIWKINDAPFNATIHTWAAAPSKKHAKLSPVEAEARIHEILDTMNQCNIKPSLVTIWSVLPVYESLHDGHPNLIHDAPEKIMQLLTYIEKKQSNNHNMLLNQVYSKAIVCCCEQSQQSKEGLRAVEIAHEIFFQRFMKLPRTQRRLEPNMEAFVKVVEGWGKQLQNPLAKDAEERLKGVLEKMEEEANRINEHKGNPLVYAFLAQAWAKSAVSDKALERCQASIDRLLMLYSRQSNYSLRLAWFHNIFAAVQENYSADKSKEFLNQLHQKLAKDPQFYKMIASGCTDESGIHAQDRELLDRVLQALVLEPGSYSGKRAEIILLKMQELHEKAKHIPPPTFATFKKVLDCWSNSLEDGAAQRSEDILLLSEELYNAGDIAMKPTWEGYMAVILAWSRSFSSEAPERIKRHLFEIKRRRSEGDSTFTLNDQLFAALIQAYARSGRGDAMSMAQAIFDATPNEMRSTAVYNALIDAHGGDSLAAEEILQTMQHSFSIEGNDLAKPNTDSFNAVLQSWLRSGSPMTAWRADSIFKRMQDLGKLGQLDVKPNSRTFDLVILSLAQDFDVQLKIESYLSLLKKHYESGEHDCAPTVTSYTEAIRAWCTKDDDPRAFLRAQALLDEMHELAREGVDSVRPDRTTYEIYLRALSQSSVEARAELANDVLLKMKENEVKIDSEMHRVLQRCFLPVDRPHSSWILKMDSNS